MAYFLSSPEPITPILVGFSDLYGLTSVSIQGGPYHPNITQSIVYEIYNHWILQYLDDRKLTHMVNW